MLIGLEKEDSKTIIKDVRKFVPKINNWAICDTFCAGLKFTRKNKEEVWSLLKIYLKSEKEFELRFAVVMILDYYIEEEYLKEDFEIFDSIKSDKYYVQMAVAWAISLALIKFYNQTVEYLKKAKIDTFTYNKAIQKAIESYRITEDKKIYLRKMKKTLEEKNAR